MESLIIALVTAVVVSTLNVVCFFIGAKVGQAVSKGEPVETPTVNPLKIYREHQAKKEVEMEQKRNETILRNIETYDGTGYGQEDVPRG